MRCYASYGYYKAKQKTRELSKKEKKLNKLVHPSNSIPNASRRLFSCATTHSIIGQRERAEKNSHFSINYILIDVPFRWLSMHSIFVASASIGSYCVCLCVMSSVHHILSILLLLFLLWLPDIFHQQSYYTLMHVCLSVLYVDVMMIEVQVIAKSS